MRPEQVDQLLFNTSTTLWSWLFPVTYLLHLAEEYWGGEGYSAYLLKLRGVQLSPTRFLVVQAIGIRPDDGGNHHVGIEQGWADFLNILRSRPERRFATRDNGALRRSAPGQ